MNGNLFINKFQTIIDDGERKKRGQVLEPDPLWLGWKIKKFRPTAKRLDKRPGTILLPLNQTGRHLGQFAGIWHP